MTIPRNKQKANEAEAICLFGRRRVLRDRLCAFRNGVLRQLTREDEPNRSLDLPRRDGRFLVVSSKLRRLRGDALKDIIDKGVQDRHGTSRDTSVWMNLFENLIDVGGIGLLPGLATLLLVASGSSGCLLASFLLLSRSLSSGCLATSARLLLGSFGRHFCE